jgi:UDP-N-acetylglucosamine 2-epimerase (non-hydrolysing)
VRDLLDAYPDLIIALPAHPNPSVRADVESIVGGDRRVVITGPVDHSDLIRLRELSTLVLADSGGIQEEAPSSGVPVLVLRDKTERTEAVDAGCAFLAGTERHVVAAAASRLFSSADAQQEWLHARNPFGDGQAGQRTAVALARLLGIYVQPMAPLYLPCRAATASGETCG